MLCCSNRVVAAGRNIEWGRLIESGRKRASRAEFRVARNGPLHKTTADASRIRRLQIERLLFHRRREDFLHRRATATGHRRSVLPTVSPDRVGHAAKRCQARVVALLVAVVDGLAWENAIAVVLV